eukprot:TRINITY_DN24122_c0_g1_i1.p1 TRINITY_DN24122_c0_g1~~TRINITY_DN24122_c0_g1_i1.p1  ORF type:complete len:1567 (+),score=377.28 TRINITY_DN24122_c0_g1_i1:130-4830(+)
MIRRPPRSTLSSSSAASDVYKRQAPPDSAEHESADLMRDALKHPELYHLSDESGSMSLRHLNEEDPILQRQMLDPADSYVLNCGDAMFVWLGDECTFQERQMAVQVAKGLFERDGHPSWMKLTRVLQGSEPAEFCKHFVEWDPPPVPSSKEPKPAKVDFEALHAAGGAVAQVDTSGEVRVWRVVSAHELEEVSEEEVGCFFTNDIYFVAHTGVASLAVYYWQGAGSGKAGMFMYSDALSQLMKALKPTLKPMEMRVVEASEPLSFVGLFAGRFICRRGGKGKHVARRKKKGALKPVVELFHVRGSCPADTRAAQVEPDAGAVNSGDAFILKRLEGSPDYVWYGRSSNDLEHSTAATLAKVLSDSGEVVELHEAEEDQPFWELLAGDRDPSATPHVTSHTKEPRLFVVVYCSGAFMVDEVPGFSQADLAYDQVAVLDTDATVYMWVGSAAMEVTRTEGQRFVDRYIRTAPDRTPASVVVEHGSEPRDFTQHFLAWKVMTVFEDPVKKRRRLQQERQDKAAQEALMTITSGTKCTVAGLGLGQSADQVAGWVDTAYTCTIQACTGEGEAQSCGGDMFEAELKSDDMFRGLKADVSDRQDGSYTVTVVPPIWGQCELHIHCLEPDLVNGSGQYKRVPVCGSPFGIWIEEPETVSAEACALSGDGLSKAVAGETARFEIAVHGLENGQSLLWKCSLELIEPAGADLPFCPQRGKQWFKSEQQKPLGVELPVSLELQAGTNRFHGSFTPMIEAVYQLDVQFSSGEQLDGSPFRVLCTDPENCATSTGSICLGSGLVQGTVSEHQVFLVHLLSGCGNSKPLRHPSSLRVTITAPDQSEVPVLAEPDDRHPHTIKFSYLPSTPGPHSVDIRIDGEHLQGSPFQLFIAHPVLDSAPREVNPRACFVPNGQVHLLEDREILLTLKDRHNEPCQLPDPQTFCCTWGNVQEPSPRFTSVHPTPDTPSTVVLTLDRLPVVKHPDQDVTVTILVHNHPVFGSPSLVKLPQAEAPVHPESSSFTGPCGDSAVTAGDALVWTIIGRDLHGTRTCCCSDEVSATVMAANQEAVCAEVPAQIEYSRLEAAWKISARPLHAGEYRVHLMVRERDLPGSPFSLTVSPASPDCFMTSVVGSGASAGRVGARSRFEVWLRDSWGNRIQAAPLSEAEQVLRVELMGPEMFSADAVEWNPELGCFQVGYTPEQEGIYTLSVQLSGCHVANSPFTCEVLHEHEQFPDSPPCEASWDEPPSVSGVWSKLSISGPPGAEFDMAVQSRHQSEKCTVIDKGDGRYTGLLKPFSTGEYTVSLSLAGQHVKGSPFSCWVQPGPASARDSVAVLTGPQAVHQMPKDFKVPMVLHLRDVFGNVVMTPPVERSKSVRSISIALLQPLGGGIEKDVQVSGEDDGTGEIRFWFGRSGWFKSSSSQQPNRERKEYHASIKYRGAEVRGSGVCLSTAGLRPSGCLLRFAKTRVEIPVGEQQCFVMEGAGTHLELTDLTIKFSHGPVALNRRVAQDGQLRTEVLFMALVPGKCTLTVEGCGQVNVDMKGSPFSMEAIVRSPRSPAQTLGTFTLRGDKYLSLIHI